METNTITQQLARLDHLSQVNFLPLTHYIPTAGHNHPIIKHTSSQERGAQERGAFNTHSATSRCMLQAKSTHEYTEHTRQMLLRWAKHTYAQMPGRHLAC